ncbi:MAG TPA: sigma 54-interacting transcriptional regulator [Longimicrobiales bacterium]|nr:sigma 54-interacting transcriptional regulator [Longimicrobiales bacterium]
MATRIPALAFQNVVGSSPSIRAAVNLGCRVAAHPGTSVLIEAETGTGKELFARGIHYSSRSASEPFVAINCSAIPEHLLESELFGHEKGAFTGADGQKRGLLEFAGKGTVFLDEIGELPSSLQPKLLRALEERRVRRIGGLREIDIQCRVIAATNRELSMVVGDGYFRADLYYRLSGFRLQLPPLRDRDGDVELLARFFVDHICREHNISTKRFAPATLDVLRAYNWPGNVRELKNAIEGSLIVCDGEVIHPEHLPLNRRNRGTASTENVTPGHTIVIPHDGLTLEAAEKQLLESTLRLANFNQSKAARMLGVSRPTIARMMEKHKLRTKREIVSE